MVACPRAWFAVILAIVSVARPAAPMELANMVPALVAVQEAHPAAPLVVAARLTKRSVVMAACPRAWSVVIPDIVSLDKSVAATVLAAIAQAEVAVVVAQVAAQTTTVTSPASLESPQHLPSTLPHSRPLRSSLSPRSTTTSSLHSLLLRNLPASGLVATIMETAAVAAAAATMEEATVALSWCLASSWASLPWFLFSFKLCLE